MNINISYRHREHLPEIEKYIREKLKKLERFTKEIVSTDVILDREGHREIAEIHIKPHKGDVVMIKEQDYNLQTAFDKADKSLEEKIKRYEKKLKHKHK